MLLSLSSSSNHGFRSFSPAVHGCESWLEPMFPEDRDIVRLWLFLAEEDEALKPETLRILLHSVGGPEEMMCQHVDVNPHYFQIQEIMHTLQLDILQTPKSYFLFPLIKSHSQYYMTCSHLYWRAASSPIMSPCQKRTVKGQSVHKLHHSVYQIKQDSIRRTFLKGFHSQRWIHRGWDFSLDSQQGNRPDCQKQLQHGRPTYTELRSVTQKTHGALFELCCISRTLVYLHLCNPFQSFPKHPRWCSYIRQGSKH